MPHARKGLSFNLWERILEEYHGNHTQKYHVKTDTTPGHWHWASSCPPRASRAGRPWWRHVWRKEDYSRRGWWQWWCTYAAPFAALGWRQQARICSESFERAPCGSGGVRRAAGQFQRGRGGWR